MVPSTDRLPDVLPAGRLLQDGRPDAALRTELRRIPGFRNALTVSGAWLQVAAVIGAAVWLDRWWAWLLAVVLMGRSFALLLILSHEAAHGFVPFDAYRRSHMAHHRDELGPEEPDAGLYAGYPISRASLRRKLTRDAVGISGWKNLRPLLRSITRASSRPAVVPILVAQLVLLAGFA